ncbi:oxidoreductase [Speluncibacter jeojiensis]
MSTRQDAERGRTEPLMVADFAPSDMPDQQGRTVLITGANGGIGLGVARALAAQGARVLLACRNPNLGDLALQRVREVSGDGVEPVLIPLDLADLASVRAAAEQVGEHTDTVDVLINNAGVMATPHSYTRDGFEKQLGTNHLGHFAFTGRVLPLLLKTPGSRVVTVASVAHHGGELKLDDLHFQRRRYRKMAAYSQSKLANLLFSSELARRLDRRGLPTISVGAHPGAAATDLFDPFVPGFPGLRSFARTVVGLMANDADHGGYPLLYAATMADVRNDDYLGPTKLGGLRGPVERSPRSKRAADPELARLLWKYSVQLTGVKYPELEPDSGRDAEPAPVRESNVGT